LIAAGIAVARAVLPEIQHVWKVLRHAMVWNKGILVAALRLMELGASWRLPRGTAANHTMPHIAVLQNAGAR
jgi:hypothetical protein